ncbi:MAG TPA: NAD(P)H-binding protein [Bacteroidales bacterium]|nr:NAD(P)H-binding protein [Bacteroidales bacterium]HOK98903.1 NAD(P)H-binding protein [Bacteroidales bacterium]HPO65101.1 NAD(P)H-binding protein [Bacteroidales bacterium]
MKVALFGGTGRTGQELLKQLLQKNIAIQALVRNPAHVKITHPLLTIIQGDVKNFESVFNTIRGTNAVISVIGYVRGSEAGFQSTALQNMIRSMEHLAIRRIIVLTGAGVPSPLDVPSWENDLLTWIIKTLAPARYSDGVNQLKLLEPTDLDWTLVRAPLLTNGPITTQYRVGYHRIGLFSRIARADVAHFITKILLENSYLRQLPLISY